MPYILMLGAIVFCANALIAAYMASQGVKLPAILGPYSLSCVWFWWGSVSMLCAVCFIVWGWTKIKEVKNIWEEKENGSANN